MELKTQVRVASFSATNEDVERVSLSQATTQPHAVQRSLHGLYEAPRKAMNAETACSVTFRHVCCGRVWRPGF